MMNDFQRHDVACYSNEQGQCFPAKVLQVEPWASAMYSIKNPRGKLRQKLHNCDRTVDAEGQFYTVILLAES